VSTAAHDLETLRDWLRYAVSRFGEAALAFGHGTTNAYDEAAYLLLHALHLPLDRLEPFLDARLTQAERTRVAQLLERRIDRRVPAAYLTQEAWLGDFRFFVDERVLIPRSFIAELLPDGIAPYVGPAEGVASALDLGTGSGCLAILLAHAYPLSTSTRRCFRRTRSRSRSATSATTASRIGSNLIRSGLFCESVGKSYDLIISNPPYVTTWPWGTCRRIPARAARSLAGEDGLDA
jgi:ribosomal protein L3 glutamine methyltransferase